MALNIKSLEVERLADEIAAFTHESKTEVIRVALEERRKRLLEEQADKVDRAIAWLKAEVWPNLSPEARVRMTREEEDELLGFGPDGV